MNKLVSISAAVIAFPMILLLLCICCPCICFSCIYDFRRGRENPSCLKILDSFSSAWSFIILRDREPNISSKKVHPFKLRSPFSVSKHYKSPDNLDKIIEKSSPEVRMHLNNTQLCIIFSSRTAR